MNRHLPLPEDSDSWILNENKQRSGRKKLGNAIRKISRTVNHYSLQERINV